MATPQQRRLEEERKRQLQSNRPKPTNNKPPSVGSKRADGKVYSGQNYGYQSPASHNKLKQDGKFKAGAQALDRATQTVSRFIPEPVKRYANAVQSAAAKNAEIDKKNRERNPVGRLQNRLQSKPSATERVLQGASDKLNVDRRIVDATANAAQSVISKKLLNKPQPQPQLRSVGAAARPSGTTAPNIRRLTTPQRQGVIRANRTPTPAAKPQTRQVSFPQGIQRGPKNFTPARRAQAIQRANSRPPEVEPKGSKTSVVRKNPLSSIENYQTRGAGNKVTHDINFDRTINQKRGPEYHFKSRSETGAAKVSVNKRRLESAAVKDLIARTVDDVQPGQTIKTTPSNSGRGRMYSRDTNGALRPDRVGEIKTQRKGPTTWKNSASQVKEWDPNTGKAQLQRLVDSKATRVGRRAHGTSNVKAKITPQKGTIAKNRRPARSVGAAARPAPNPAQPQPGKRLGGPDKRIAFQRTYHGTSEWAAQKIRANGYIASPTGVYGPGVYTGNKKMAAQYAKAAGGDNGRVLEHRVPKKRQTNVPFQSTGNRQRTSPQTDLVQGRLRRGQTTRIDYGKGSHVTPLTREQANKTLVPANGKLRVSKAQAARLKAKKASQAPQSQRLNYDNVAASESNYFKPGKGNIRFGAHTEALQELANLKKTGGFTVSTGRARSPKGNMVAIDGKVLRNPTPQRLQKFLEDNKGILSRPDAAIGGWTSKRTGKPVVEISRRIPSSKEATRLGKKFQQEGVYDTRTGQYTSTGGKDQLRFTKGNQTAGGARIGGQRSTSKLQAPKGTIKKRVPVPASKTQATPSRTVKLGPGIRGEKNFTPARRAQALQRANQRRVEHREGYGGYSQTRITNHGAGVVGNRSSSPGPRGIQQNDIAFANSQMRGAAKQGRPQTDFYGSRSDLRLSKQSKVRDRIGKAALKDMMGKLLNIDNGGMITATPTTGSRGTMYARATKRAIGTPHGQRVASTRVSDDRWINHADGNKSVQFNPSSLKEALQKIASSKATRVGRRAGGTSKTQARIGRMDGQTPNNAARRAKEAAKKAKAANAKKAKLAKANPSKLFPQGRRATEPTWLERPHFPGTVYSQGPARGTFRDNGPRSLAFNRAWNRAARQIGARTDSARNSEAVNDRLVRMAEMDVASQFPGPAPGRDFSRTYARAARIRARGGEMRPRRRSGPQTRR